MEKASIASRTAEYAAGLQNAVALVSGDLTPHETVDALLDGVIMAMTGDTDYRYSRECSHAHLTHAHLIAFTLRTRTRV